MLANFCKLNVYMLAFSFPTNTHGATEWWYAYLMTMVEYKNRQHLCCSIIWMSVLDPVDKSTSSRLAIFTENPIYSIQSNMSFPLYAPSPHSSMNPACRQPLKELVTQISKCELWINQHYKYVLGYLAIVRCTPWVNHKYHPFTVRNHYCNSYHNIPHILVSTRTVPQYGTVHTLCPSIANKQIL